MPLPPPTRPHSAHPNPTLPAPIFPRSSTPNSAPPNRPDVNRGASMSSFTNPRETDWEDAWDSSSDKEDGEESVGGSSADLKLKSAGVSGMSGSGTDPIPIRNGAKKSLDKDNQQSGSGSWASSFQHISHPSSSSPHRQPSARAPTNKNGSSPDTAPGPQVEKSPAGPSVTSKLPPGGAWEIVEPAEVLEDGVKEKKKVGKEAVRSDIEDILRDPLHLLQSLSLEPGTPTTAQTPSYDAYSPSTPNPTSSKTYPHASMMSPDFGSSSHTPSHLRTPGRKEGVSRQRSVRTERQREQFARVLKGRTEDGGGVEVDKLRKLAWKGIPSEVRPIAWQLLLNYLPLPTQPRLTTLSRKRKEYSQLVDQYFGRGLSSLDQQIWHQIEIDVPRTRPGAPLWSCETAQRSLEKILYVWAIRHPASGYVQGINDLVTPFFEVFLGAYVDTDPELFDIVHLPPHILSAIEADSFWCLSKLLDGIQDNYISQQPGIQRLVKRMGELVKRIDSPLATHFEEQGVEYMQFAFRWMNCLLMRELSVKCTIRMWDTYLSEGTDAFSQFHLYVCSALLVKYSERLREMDFQEIIMFLQCLPTQSWTDHDIELLLSEAYVLKTVWQGAENHFANLANGGGGFGMLGR